MTKRKSAIKNTTDSEKALAEFNAACLALFGSYEKEDVFVDIPYTITMDMGDLSPEAAEKQIRGIGLDFKNAMEAKFNGK